MNKKYFVLVLVLVFSFSLRAMEEGSDNNNTKPDDELAKIVTYICNKKLTNLPYPKKMKISLEYAMQTYSGLETELFTAYNTGEAERSDKLKEVLYGVMNEEGVVMSPPVKLLVDFLRFIPLDLLCVTLFEAWGKNQ